MSTVRSRRWTVEVSVAGEQRAWRQDQPVECVWIDYWQPAGSSTIVVQSVELWGRPWGDRVAALDTLDVRDRAPDWLRDLIAEHWPVAALRDVEAQL